MIGLAFIAWVSLGDHFSSVSNNKNNSRRDAKTQIKDYYVSVFSCAFASSREKLFLSVRALLADNEHE